MEKQNAIINPLIAVSGFTDTKPERNNGYNVTLSVVSVSVFDLHAGVLLDDDKLRSEFNNNDINHRPKNQFWNVARFMSLRGDGRYPLDFLRSLRETDKYQIAQHPYIAGPNPRYDSTWERPHVLTDVSPIENAQGLKCFQFPFISMIEVAELREKAQNPFSFNLIPTQLRNACNYIRKHKTILEPFFPEIGKFGTFGYPRALDKTDYNDKASIAALHSCASLVFRLAL